MKHVGVALVGLGLLGLASAAVADAPGIALSPDAIIAARQAGFSLMGGDFGAMKGAISAKADVKPFAETAKAIGLWARSIPDLFPAGTDKGHDTQAKPDIWSDNAGFKKDAQALADAAGKLAQAADSGDKVAFATQFKDTAKACGTCHHTYRVKRPD